MNESYERVTSPVHESCHIGMSLATYEWVIWMTHITELCNICMSLATYAWVIWRSHASRTWVLAHRNESYGSDTSHIHATYTWVIPRIWMRHMNETYEWVTSRSHTTYTWVLSHIHESRHIRQIKKKESKDLAWITYTWVLPLTGESRLEKIGSLDFPVFLIHMWLMCMWYESVTWLIHMWRRKTFFHGGKKLDL